MLRILLVDDHAVVRKGIIGYLEETAEVAATCDQAANAAEALAKVAACRYDMVLLDISMPGENGLGLLKQLHKDHPALPVLLLSMHPEEQYAVRTIRAGASGYLSKEEDSDFFLPAIRRVVAGGMYISPKVAELLAQDVSHKTSPTHAELSNREFEVLIRIVRGVSLTDISKEFNLSIKTISTHKTHVLTKLGLASQADLVRYAIEHKLLDLDG